MFKRKNITILFIIITIMTGLAATWYTWNYTKKKLSAEALEQTRIIARAIDVGKVQKLTGTIADLTKQEYILINKQLRFIREGHSSCRFLYLMGKKSSGSIFFFLDSQPAESKDAVLPGLMYDEVSDEYKETFDTGREQTVGPITDRWGRLVTSLVPIYDEDGAMVAVLGMDIGVDDWNARIVSNILLPIILMLSIVLLTLLLLLLNRNRVKLVTMHKEKDDTLEKLEKALADVKQLQGILPICASCKKIRDNKGYWSQIESYISKHTDADFTHSICPD